TTSRDPRRPRETCQQRYPGMLALVSVCSARRKSGASACLQRVAAGTEHTDRDLPRDSFPAADRKASKVSVRTADVAPRAPASFPTCFERSERIKRRRGLTFLAMTLVLPGSAQLAGGSRRIGMFALRIWARLWLLALLAGLLGFPQPKAALAVITLGPILKALQIGAVIVGLGWVGLVVDAWRLANPGEQGRGGRGALSARTV